MKMKKTNSDVLGQVYMQWNQNNKYRGQFFTPSHIASMMAQILEPKGNILDPCCGSGIMLIEAIKTMDNRTIENAVFWGQDIDLTCVKMCALNLMFFNVNGFVVWGDSLVMECNKVYGTSRSFMGGSIRELTVEELEKFKSYYQPSLQKVIESKPILENKNTEQLSFF
jgi:tRNA G10  N-methylase Trm11